MIIDKQTAIERLKNGEVVALPTETVYGLAASASQPEAIRQVFEIKGRPRDNPLIVHLAGPHQVDEFTPEFFPTIEKLIEVFWPGPLTIVVPCKAGVNELITAGLDSVALRVPAHPITLEILDQTGPLVAPSANPSGKPSPTKAIHVEQDYEGSISVVDGGSTQIGLESTVVDCRNPNEFWILRPGALYSSSLAAVCEIPVRVLQDKAPILDNDTDSVKGKDHIFRSPGMKYTHYKPHASVFWAGNKLKPNGSLHASLPDETLLILHSAEAPEEFVGRVVHVRGDFSTLGTLLYDLFRWVDRIGLQHIYIESLPDLTTHPILPALHNRISRAIGEYS